MHDTIKAELHVRTRRLSDLWTTRAMFWRTSIAVGVQVLGQFTGINSQYFISCLLCSSLILKYPTVINYYGPEMYESLVLDSGKVLLVQGIYGAVGPIANFMCV